MNDGIGKRRSGDADSVSGSKDKPIWLLDEKAAAGQGPASGKGDDPSMVRYLRSKLYHFEKTVERLEKERSALTVRATMAEEQLKVLQ